MENSKLVSFLGQVFADWIAMAKVITDDMKVKQGQEERSVSKNRPLVTCGGGILGMELEDRNGPRGTEKYLSILILTPSRVKNLHILKFASESYLHGLLGGEKILESNPAKKYQWGEKTSSSFSLAVEHAAFNGSQDTAELLVTDLAAAWSMLHFLLYTRRPAEVPKITL